MSIVMPRVEWWSLPSSAYSRCAGVGRRAPRRLAGIWGRRQTCQFGVQAEITGNECRVPANEEFDKDHGRAALRPCRGERDVYVDQSDERSRLTIPPRSTSFTSSNYMRHLSWNEISDIKGEDMNISPTRLSMAVGANVCRGQQDLVQVSR